ncbi:hypothetical protein HYW20_00080 [Candidatus Woesearchaeota archaeon]|nr:hypothetical protein [Candidatus Woesearchaeota archaeon]
MPRQLSRNHLKPEAQFEDKQIKMPGIKTSKAAANQLAMDLGLDDFRLWAVYALKQC